jgi:predicted negative regulator of RcsB-dependent stress response
MVDRLTTQKRALETMNRNVLYLIIGALVVVVAVIGYQLYQDRQKTNGIQINVGKSGISIEKK